jgi:hypothetical protein
MTHAAANAEKIRNIWIKQILFLSRPTNLFRQVTNLIKDDPSPQSHTIIRPSASTKFIRRRRDSLCIELAFEFPKTQEMFCRNTWYFCWSENLGHPMLSP